MLARQGCRAAAATTHRPELNPAGRKFKLLGYVDKDKEKKGVTDDSSKRHAGLDILSSLPLSAMFETSLTATKTPQPGTQNGNFEFPQDVSVFLAGAWADARRELYASDL